MILAYDFQPYVSVGALRPDSWYKYLSEFDIFPIIITRQWSNVYGNELDYISPSETDEIIVEKSEKGEIIRVPSKSTMGNKLYLKYGNAKFSFLRKIVSFYYEFFQYFFHIGPKHQIYLAAQDYLKNNTVDCIIATGDPFVLFRYASNLSREFNRPWIADYRDLWSLDWKLQRKPLMKIWNHFLEKRIVSTAHCITTVNEYFIKRLSVIFKEKKLHLIRNGYDPEAVRLARDVKQESGTLTIGYAGTIYPYHPAESFLRVISRFTVKYQDAKIKIKLMGINRAVEISDFIKCKEPGLQNIVTILPKMENKTLMKEMAKCNLLLLFNDYHNIGTKIYDYLGIRRKILFCFSRGTVENNEYFRNFRFNVAENYPQVQLLKSTNAGYVIEDPEDLFRVLENLHRELHKEGLIQFVNSDTEKFTRKEQARELAFILKRTRQPA